MHCTHHIWTCQTLLCQLHHAHFSGASWGCPYGRMTFGTHQLGMRTSIHTQIGIILEITIYCFSTHSYLDIGSATTVFLATVSSQTLHPERWTRIILAPQENLSYDWSDNRHTRAESRCARCTCRGVECVRVRVLASWMTTTLFGRFLIHPPRIPDK